MTHAGNCSIHFGPHDIVTCKVVVYEPRCAPALHASHRRTKYMLEFEGRWHRIYNPRTSEYQARIRGQWEAVTFAYQHL